MIQKHNLTIQVVSAIGGILTAIFFLGFLALANIIRSEASCLILGSLLLLVTLTISRIATRPFLDAMNITFYIAGCALMSFGISHNTNTLFLVLIGVSMLTFFLSKGFILPFLSVLLFNICVSGETAYIFSSYYPLQLAIIPILGVFLFIHLLETELFQLIGGSPKYRPFHFGFFVSALIALGGLSIRSLIPETDNWALSCILSVAIWVGVLLLVQRIMRVMKVENPSSQVGIYVLCILICLPTVLAPYLSGSLLLILVCFHYGYRAECTAALLFFIYAVTKYYYDLDMSLLIKSITLFATGIGFIAAWYFFTQKRTKLERTEHEKI